MLIMVINNNATRMRYATPERTCSRLLSEPVAKPNCSDEPRDTADTVAMSRTHMNGSSGSSLSMSGSARPPFIMVPLRVQASGARRVS